MEIHLSSVSVAFENFKPLCTQYSNKDHTNTYHIRLFIGMRSSEVYRFKSLAMLVNRRLVCCWRYPLLNMTAVRCLLTMTFLNPITPIWKTLTCFINLYFKNCVHWSIFNIHHLKAKKWMIMFRVTTWKKSYGT